DLPNQLCVLVTLRVTNLVAEARLDVLAAQRGHHLVAPHPDVAMDAPDRQDQAMVGKRPKPRDGVVVIGVDEGAVDVQDSGGHSRHALVLIRALVMSPSTYSRDKFPDPGRPTRRACQR